MCGIVGQVAIQPSEKVLPERVKAMSDLISYRGPNDDGFLLDAAVGLGHRRLAVVSPETGRQPIYNEDRTVAVILNGEIYNYVELRDELKKKGHTFRTQTDTEVINHAYEEWGLACVHRFIGMFAFALWDAPKKRLVVCRDRLGVKPLYYRDDGKKLTFASEMKCLFLDPEVKREINPQALSDFLSYNYVPMPETIFKGVRHVPPGHMILVENGASRLERYWDIPACGSPAAISEDEAAERILALLKDATRIRMRCDVNVGAFLSGGLDSSLIVALMAECKEKDFKTFCVGFKEEAFSELPFARRVAEQYKTNHKEWITESDVVSLWPRVLWHLEQPHGDASFLPMFQVAKFAHEQDVIVCLNGDGSDEVFGGFGYYADFPAAAGDVNGLYKFFNRTAIFSEELKHGLLRPDFVRRHGIDSAFRILDRAYHETSGPDLLNRYLRAEQKLLLPGNNLVKPDRCGAPHSIEARSPFLDYRIVELAQSLPSSMKVKDGMGKRIVKKIAERYLPHDLVHRKKQMFTVPIGEWFRDRLRPFVEKLLRSPRFLDRGLFDPGTVEDLMTDHFEKRANYTRELRALVAAELWHRLYIDRFFTKPPAPEEILG
ncbi:MAG TPA: asparagine synthase (glutamine-hydrolyzing) [Planctomycetota bacterium]